MWWGKPWNKTDVGQVHIWHIMHTFDFAYMFFWHFIIFIYLKNTFIPYIWSQLSLYVPVMWSDELWVTSGYISGYGLPNTLMAALIPVLKLSLINHSFLIPNCPINQVVIILEIRCVLSWQNGVYNGTHYYDLETDVFLTRRPLITSPSHQAVSDLTQIF